MPIKLFVNGEDLDAPEVNQYLMDQAVVVFDNSTQRDAAFGGSGEPVLQDGRICYLKSDQTLYIYVGIPGSGGAWTPQIATISNGSVVEAKIGPQAVTEAKIASLAVTEAKIGAQAVTEAKLGAQAVTETKLANNSVTSAKIVNGTIVNEDINSSAGIVDTKLAQIVTENKVAINSIDIDGAIDIALDLDGSDLIIVDKGAVGANRKSQISRFLKYIFSNVSGDISVTSTGTSTVGPQAVTEAKIGSQAVTEAKIGSQAVTEAKIADYSVTSTKIGPTSIQAAATTYTLSLSDRNKIIEVDSSSQVTVQVPRDSVVNFPVGSMVTIVQVGTGNALVQQVSGSPTVNIRSSVNGYKTRVQWSVATLYKRATNEWVIFGDLKP